MADRSDSMVTALAAAGGAFGLAAVLAPGPLAAAYGLPGDPGLRWALRGWGTRTTALGGLGLTLKGDARRSVLTAVALLSAADVVVAALAGHGLTPRSRVQAAVTSGAFATIAGLLRSAG